MRDWLIVFWRKVTTIKFLSPIIKFIRYAAGTNIFNTILDFVERNIFHTSYMDKQDFYNGNIDRIHSILNYLADEKSKKVYQNVWLYRITHKRLYLKNIVDKDQYFDKKIIQLTNEEVFVDCGAYKGDTITKFIKLYNSIEFKIIAFEPDQHNYKVLRKTVWKLNYRNRIELYNLGTWSSKKTLRFLSNTEEACMIFVDGDTDIDVDTIDNIMGNNKVTFIKMDVEGAEMDSLMGAKKVIEKYHPRLAISIYHSDEDMINIAEYIHNNYPFYKIYIRHYTFFYGDTVLYAIHE